MSKPFPGMDPFLEKPGFWHEFHNSLIYLSWFAHFLRGL
ncbi:DUF4058 family protein, partial [Armatimonas sp.]